MQQEEFLEQITNELKTMSEDFNHDENISKSLVKSILESKPHVQQDQHFKTQLSNNLARHIARKKNPVPTSAVSQSRLARFIAYGLPGLTLCFVVFYTLPFGGEDLSKTFETDTTTFQIPLPVETGSTDLVSSGEIVDSGTQEGGDIQTPTSPEIVNNQGTELLDVQDSTEEEMSEELMLLLGIIPASQNKSTQTNTQQDTSSSQQNPSTTEPEHIPVQTTTPANGTPSSQQTVLMKGVQTPTSTQEVTTSDSGHTATTASLALSQQDPQDVISEERKLFAEQLGKLLSVNISVRQGDIVDCLSKEGTLTCDLLTNRSFDKENKSLLLDEIAKNLPSELIDKMTMMQIRMILGL